MTQLAATEAERLEREAFETEMRKTWGPEHFVRIKGFEGECYDSKAMNCVWLGWQARASQQSAAQAAAEPATPTATADSAADARDAARYRWLRLQGWYESPLCVLRDPKAALTSGKGLGADCPSHVRLDEAIDAAMQAKEG